MSRKDVVVPLASSMSTGLLLERGGRPAHVEEAVGRARVVEFGRASNLATAPHVFSSAAIMANVASARGGCWLGGRRRGGGRGVLAFVGAEEEGVNIA